MFKGLISLFTSGTILNPMVFLGIFLGLFCVIKLGDEQISEFFKDYHLYLAALFLSFLYNISFKKVYRSGGHKIDAPQMSLNIIWGGIKFLLSCLLTISFVILISF